LESPDHEREAVEDFVRRWSREPELTVEHAEKVQAEAVYGRTHDVWDVHLPDGQRLWVVTEPMFAYPQREIRSLDIALSFHIGLVTRMRYGAATESAAPEITGAAVEVDRYQQQMHNALMAAAEVAELQAIGVRARETLLRLADLMFEAFSEGEPSRGEPPRRADFLTWSRSTATRALPGKSLARLRAGTINAAEDAWHAANWLTHARSASYIDAMLVVSLVDRTVDTFRLAISRHKQGSDPSCEKCGSRRWRVDYRREDSDPDHTFRILTCIYCGAEAAPEPFVEPERKERPVEGDCVPLEDFSPSLTPARLEAELKRVSSESQVGEQNVAIPRAGEAASWGNFFTVEVDGLLVDVRRFMYMHKHGPIPPGSAITHGCERARCVHPDHGAVEGVDEAGDMGWRPAVVDAVVLGERSMFLSLSLPSFGNVYAELTEEVMRHLDMFDPSMWLERHVMIAYRDGERTAKVLPLADSGDPGTLRPTHVALFSSAEVEPELPASAESEDARSRA
jgi:hypothetical protein